MIAMQYQSKLCKGQVCSGSGPTRLKVVGIQLGWASVGEQNDRIIMIVCLAEIPGAAGFDAQGAPAAMLRVTALG
jgi:hypothetical protein